MIGLEEQNEMIGVTPDMLASHTNMQGDVSSDKKHFAEISFDGFRICLSTSESMPLVDFNDELLRFWSRLDEFMMEKQRERKKTTDIRGGRNQSYG
jgi:hypothetical protein